MPTKGSTVEPRTKASLGGDRKGGDVPKSWSPTATPGIGPTPSIERLGASVTQADQDKPPSQVNEAGRDREIRAVTRLPQGFTQSVRDAHRNEQATSETHPCAGRIHQCAPCPTTRLRAHGQGASANIPTRIPAATQHDETEDGTLVGAKKRDRDAPNQRNVVATPEANIAPSSERTVRLADGSFAAQPREKRSIGEDKQAGDLPDLEDAAPQLHGTTDMLAPLISLPFGMERPAKDALASRPTTGTHQINRNSEAIYAPSSTPSNSQSTRPDPIERSAHDPPLHQGPADVLKRVFDELVTLAREGIDPEDETGVGGRDRKKARRVNIAVDRDPRQSVALRKKKTRAEQRRKQQSRERLRSRAGELARKRARRPQTEVPAGTRVSDRAEPCNRDPDLTESTRPGHTTSNCGRAPDPLTRVARSRATSTTPADSTTPGSGHEGHSLDLSSARTTEIGRGRIAGEAGVRQGSRDAGEYTCWPYKGPGPRTLDDPSPASGRIHSPAMPPQRRGLLARYSAAPVLVQPSPIRSVLSVPPDLPRGYLPPRDIERIVDFDNHHGRGPSAGSMVLSSSNCTIQRAYNETDGAQRLVFHCQNGALAFQHANQRSTGVASFTGTVYGGSRVDRATIPSSHPHSSRGHRPRSQSQARTDTEGATSRRNANYAYADALRAIPMRPAPFSDAWRATPMHVEPPPAAPMHSLEATARAFDEAWAFGRYAGQPARFPAPYSETTPNTLRPILPRPTTSDTPPTIDPRRVLNSLGVQHPPYSTGAPAPQSPLQGITERTRTLTLVDEGAVLRTEVDAADAAAGPAPSTSSVVVPAPPPTPVGPASTSQLSPAVPIASLLAPALADKTRSPTPSRQDSPQLQYPESSASSASPPRPSFVPGIRAAQASPADDMDTDSDVVLVERSGPSSTLATAGNTPDTSDSEGFEGVNRPAKDHFSPPPEAEELDSDTVIINIEDLPKGRPRVPVIAPPAAHSPTMRECIERIREEYEPRNEALTSSYDTDRDAETSAQVRPRPNMAILLRKLTSALESAAHPMDKYTCDYVRIALVKTYRAVRARARRDYAKGALHLEQKLKADLRPRRQTATRGRKPAKASESFRGNQLLHRKERDDLGKLRDYFARYRTADYQRGGIDDTDTVLRLIDTALEFDAAREYSLVLCTRCTRGDFGGPGEYPTHQ
ncbi:uncharacterized protein B0H18DRAFT_1130509 [Fomitopsis serialis]|uniref:uncharacterized protein n=1 Tax=Fomitopsis serialis TaxID=139415 RepID=UPI0020084EEE|nr:uncharacterized protein B0H18DRAFT_1130509 [Neoantrodia serialis]KAH9910229.1 hypothetical protein B0H18DRAFT_1130509 [Neoantrodia serialis]